MGKINPFRLKVFLEQWLPRLVAVGILGYLAYSLFFRQDEFSGLYIIALLIVTALILAPMARRLRVPNLIDFKSKLDGLEEEQRETKAQLNQLTNQISTVVSTHVNPIQVISLQGFQQLISNTEETKSKSTNEGTKYTKVEFLRLANGCRNRALPLLMLTRSFQIAINEHRFFSVDRDTVQCNTIDERIKNLVNTILQHDLRTVFPIEVADEKTGKTYMYPIITPDIIEGLRQINSLLDLSHRIKTGEEELPSSLDIDNLFNKVLHTLAVIGTGLEIVAADSILHRYRVTSTLKALEEEIKKADAEQRPISFPPTNSD